MVGAVIIGAGGQTIVAADARSIASHTCMLRSGTLEQKLEAAKMLAGLAANGHGAGSGALSATDARTEIARAGSIEALIALARDDTSSEVKAAVAAALANVAANAADNQAAIAAAGGIPALIALVRNSAPEPGAPQRANAAVALGNLALGHPANQTAVDAEGGIAALIGLLRQAGSDGASQSDELEWQEEAAGAALRAVTSGHVPNLETMRGLLDSAELAIVMNDDESGGGGPHDDGEASPSGELTAVLDAPTQLKLLAGFVGGEPIEIGTVRYDWSTCGMVGTTALEGDVFVQSLEQAVGHNDRVTPTFNDCGLVDDWEAAELLWRETLFRRADGGPVRRLNATPRRLLGVEKPHRLRVLLMLPSVTTRPDVVRVAGIFLEQLGVAAVHIVPREALFAADGAHEAAESSANGASCWHAASAHAADGASSWLRSDSELYAELGPESGVVKNSMRMPGVQITSMPGA